MEHAHTEEFDGFVIALDLEPEHEAPDWDFESDEDRDETMRKIENGTYLWFMAKVTASKNGIVLATEYLGGCCYESVAAFIEPDGYYTDMRATVADEAKAAIAKLCA